MIHTASISWAERATKLSARAKSSSSVNFKAVDFLSDDHLCGLNSNNRVTCYDWSMNLVDLPDSVVGFQSPSEVLASESAVCGFDVDGVKCLFQDRARIKLRELLNESDPKLTGAHGANVCGVNAKTGILRCLVPDWYNFSRRSFRVQPKNKITAIGVGVSTICWSDGNVINCQTQNETRALPFNGAFEILTTPNICARSATEAKCWNWDNTPVALSSEFLTAKKWLSDLYSTFGAITSDNRFVVLDMTTGAARPAGSLNIPPVFEQPGSTLVDVWMGDYQRFCSVDTNSTVQCWRGYASGLYGVSYAEPVVGFTKGIMSKPCALLKSGQVQCADEFGTRLRSLPSAGPVHPILLNNQSCHWNQKSMSCSVDIDFSALESILTVAVDRSLNDVCAIGTRSGSTTREVMCRQEMSLEQAPQSTLGARSLSVGRGNACAISPNGINCWGTEFKGEARPASFLDPIKVELTETYACALDVFGLVCWGDLTTHNLQVPSILGGPGAVTDFALGKNRACALLSTGVVQCWGASTVLDEEPPAMIGVTAIYGSRQHAFCAIDALGLHCWGGDTMFPR